MRIFKLAVLLGTFLLFACKSNPKENIGLTTIQVSNIKKGSVIELIVNDMMVREFFSKKYTADSTEFSFKYHRYRPLNATLSINGKHNTIYLTPQKSKYQFELDTTGYLSFNNLIDEYINDLAINTGSNCGTQSTIDEVVTCIDDQTIKQHEILEKYLERGLPSEYYDKRKTEIFYSRYENYANAALSRKYMFEFNEDNTQIIDSITNMPTSYGEYKSSEKRAQAIHLSNMLITQSAKVSSQSDSTVYERLFYKHKDDPYLATILLSNTYDKPYRDSNFVEVLKAHSIPTYVKSLNDKIEIGKAFNFSRKYWHNQVDEVVDSALLENKVSFVNFWFPGCKPCITSIPEKNSMIEFYADNPKFQLINISCDFSKYFWEQYMDRYQMEGRHYYVPPELQEQHDEYYNLISFPKYMLLYENKLVAIEQFPPGSEELYELINNKISEIQ